MDAGLVFTEDNFVPMSISDNKLRLASLLFVVIGLLDAAYLSYVKVINSQVFCGTSQQCEIVNNSSYSEIAGVPIAYLGFGAYLVIGLLHTLETRDQSYQRNVPLIIFGLSLTGVLYSAYLTYIEIAVLRAICPYCVVSAVVILLIFLISIVRVASHQS